MKGFFYSSSLRYALALWLATVLALLIAFVVQLEPAQWAAITVWIVFIQNPRMNYSKIIWWTFGTVTGAFMAVILTVFFNQTPELFLLFLALWLAACAGYAPLVTSYRAYGAVLAGYTCAIVSMSAVDHPDLIFRLAATRVSCIFIGMASAIVMIGILLPKHRHWRETKHHLGEHLKATLLQVANALDSNPKKLAHFTWRHMVDRLSTLEHTLDVTTAESADSRLHTPPVRSLVATLFDLLAKAQAIEIHLSRTDASRPATDIAILLERGEKMLSTCATAIATDKMNLPVPAMVDEITRLCEEIAAVRERIPGETTTAAVSNGFVLDRLNELLEEFAYALQDWAGLFGPWTAKRPSRLAEHKDYRSAAIYGLRMFLAMGLASVFWFVTQWPSGPQFILFIAVVCSLLSLVDHAPELGLPFLKSAAFCAIMAYVETFWLFQKNEGFILLALMLGVFLLPAAYAYRHPRLIGGAVVSMLIFYGLSLPSNQMHYDIAAFLNNGLALLLATAGGFFAFHAVPSLTSAARQFWLLHAVRRDLARDRKADGPLEVQSWTSRMFDRLRLLHRAADGKSGEPEWLEAENEILISLQLGLRERCLSAKLKAGGLPPDFTAAVTGVLQEFRLITRHPAVVAVFVRSVCSHLDEILGRDQHKSEPAVSALAEMWEMTFLLEATTRLYTR